MDQLHDSPSGFCKSSSTGLYLVFTSHLGAALNKFAVVMNLNMLELVCSTFCVDVVKGLM